jgi:hypothetical protein
VCRPDPPGADRGRARDAQSTTERHGDPVDEYVVLGPLDLIQDAAVQRKGRTQTVSRCRVDEVDTGRCRCVEPPRPLDLASEQRADRSVDASRPGGTLKAFAIDPARSQRFLREIDAPEAEIFGNVADEVGQLERDAEVDGMGSKRLPRNGLIGAPEDR